MLHELQQRSREWPLWQSRGLRENVSQAAVSLCIHEMEQKYQQPAPTPPRGDPADFISALEWLLQDHTCSFKEQSRATDSSSLFEQLETAPDLVSRSTSATNRGTWPDMYR
jgi:hypothetical protein